MISRVLLYLADGKRLKRNSQMKMPGLIPRNRTMIGRTYVYLITTELRMIRKTIARIRMTNQIISFVMVLPSIRASVRSFAEDRTFLL